jgi:major membrane immunogen (membrane-anchored lipoprotein)
MRRTLFYLILTALLLPACSKKTGTTITTVKPKYHHRWYDRKKDRKTKRIRTVRVKN